MSRSIAFAFMSSALAAGMVFAACGGSQTQVTNPSALSGSSALPSDASAVPASSTPPGAPTGPGARPTISGDNVAPPLVLKLTGPTPPPDKGEIKLSVDIVTSVKIAGPVTLTIKLPAGATLKSGSATESLQIAEVGTIKREFVVLTTAALAGPIVVTADNAAPSGASGFHAERQYPAPTDPAVGGSSMKPPVGRPSGPPPGKSH